MTEKEFKHQMKLLEKGAVSFIEGFVIGAVFYHILYYFMCDNLILDAIISAGITLSIGLSGTAFAVSVIYMYMKYHYDKNK